MCRQCERRWLAEYRACEYMFLLSILHTQILTFGSSCELIELALRSMKELTALGATVPPPCTRNMRTILRP